MKIGITGHQNLDNPAWVKQEILRILRLQTPPLVGVSSLAVGADQLFAQAVLESGGLLHIIVPFNDYIQSFQPEGRAEYERLLAESSQTEVLPMAASKEESYYSAGKSVVDASDLLIAVWNGKPAAGLGGTADIVKYAQQRGKNYVIINPVT